MNPKTGEVSDTPVEMMDVYQEFSELSEKFKIMKFKSKVRRCQKSVYSYCTVTKCNKILTDACFFFSL